MNLLRLILGFLGDLLKRFADPEEAKKQDELRAEAKRRDAVNAEAEKRVAEYREANAAEQAQKVLEQVEQKIIEAELRRIQEQREELKREKTGTTHLSDADAVRVHLPLE